MPVTVIGVETAMNAVLRAIGMKTVSLGTVCCVLAASLLGCGGEPVWMRGDPSDFVQNYLVAVEAQNRDDVWEFLSADTRRGLDKRADSLNQQRSESSPALTGRDMLRFGHVMYSTREYKKIREVSSDDKQAQVHIVLHDDSVIPVNLHRESGRWAIDLPLDGDLEIQ